MASAGQPKKVSEEGMSYQTGGIIAVEQGIGEPCQQVTSASSDQSLIREDPHAKLPSSQPCFGNDPLASYDFKGDNNLKGPNFQTGTSVMPTGLSSQPVTGGTPCTELHNPGSLDNSDIASSSMKPYREYSHGNHPISPHIHSYPTSEETDTSRSEEADTSVPDIKEHEYPPEYKEKHFDAIIINSNIDDPMAKGLKTIFERFMCLDDKRPPSICVLDEDDEDSRFDQADRYMERSTYMFLLMTKSFTADTWAKMLKEECLERSLNDETRKWCVVPLHTVEKRQRKYPFGLRSKRGIDITNLVDDLDPLSSESYKPGAVIQKLIEQIQGFFNKRLGMKVGREEDQNRRLQKWQEVEKFRRQNELDEHNKELAQIRKGVGFIGLNQQDCKRAASRVPESAQPPQPPQAQPSVVNIYNYGTMQYGSGNIQTTTLNPTQADTVDSIVEDVEDITVVEESDSSFNLTSSPHKLMSDNISCSTSGMSVPMCEHMRMLVHDTSVTYDEMKSELSSRIAPSSYVSCGYQHESFTHCQSHLEDIDKADFEAERQEFVTFNSPEIDELISDLSDVLDQIQELLPGINSKLHGSFEKTGSFIDGSKVREIDEFDCVFVCKSDQFKNMHSEKTNNHKDHTRKLFLSNHSEVNAGELRDEFADALQKAIYDVKLPSKLKHSGYNSEDRRFAGIRINKPTCTILLKSCHDHKWRSISLDITIAFRLPKEDEKDMKKLVLERIDKLRSNQKGFDAEGKLHLVPVVDDVWQITTTVLEAYLLSHCELPDDLLRICMRLGKCLSYKYITSHAREVHLKFCDQPAGKYGKIQSEILGALENHTCSLAGCNGTGELLRYGHTLLPPQTAERFGESSKSIVAVDSAAIKHLVMKEIICNEYYQKKGDDPNKKIVQLLGEVFSHLGDGEHNAVDHVMLCYPIKMISVSPYAIDSKRELIECAKLRCSAIAERLQKQLEENFQ